MKKYSVLIPAYNAEKYIVECVESIFKQSGINLYEILEMVEIIIANDGSIDATKEICESISKKYRNVQLFNKSNDGLVATRTFLIHKATAEYIIFLDADDKWEPNMIITLNNYIEKYNNPDIISFSFNIFDKHKKYPYDKELLLYCDNNKEKAWEALLCVDYYNSIWSKIIKREILLKSKIDSKMININRGEDKIRVISCLEEAKSILFVPDKLYNYRIDNMSMTRSFNDKYFDEILIVDSYVYEKIINNMPYDITYLIQWSETLIKKYIDYIVVTFYSLDKYEAKKCISYYESNEIVRKCIMYARKSAKLKTKIKAYMLQFKMYYLIVFLIGRYNLHGK